MSIKVRAVYDGKTALQLEGPIDLPKDAEVTITVDPTAEDPTANDSGEGRYLFFKAARAAKLQGPSDWSSRLDEYLYHGREMPNPDDE